MLVLMDGRDVMLHSLDTVGSASFQVVKICLNSGKEKQTSLMAEG